MQSFYTDSILIIRHICGIYVDLYLALIFDKLPFAVSCR